MTSSTDFAAQVIANELGISRGTAKICIGAVGALSCQSDRNRREAEKVLLSGMLEEIGGVPVDVDDLEEAVDDVDRKLDEEGNP